MITDYLKAGFPAILLQTQEPHRADELMRRIPGWQICRWDCVSGVHGMARHLSLSTKSKILSKLFNGSLP